MFNFKDVTGQNKFRELTEDSTALSSIFDSDGDIEVKCKKFLKKLDNILHQSFRKIRITKKKDTDIDILFRKQKVLKKKKEMTKKDKKELADVESELASTMADDLYEIVKEEVKIVKSDEGGFNSGHLWRLKNKLRPKYNNCPTAMLDINGKLVTKGEELKKLTMEHYKRVLTNRPIKSELIQYQTEREQLCQERIKEASKNVTKDWTEKEVINVIKNLKKKKSRDPLGYSNELIQCGGKDVTRAITKLMNTIKKQQKFPQCLRACNITSLYKHKGSRKDFNMYRGIF